MQNGIDIFLQSSKYKKHRLALVTNNAAVIEAGQLNRVALLQSGFNLVKLFSPEHGITRTGEDGAPMQHHTDTETGLPVISLYGHQHAPSAVDLEGIDILLFD